MPDESREQLRADLKRGMNLTHERHVTIRTGIICGSIVLIAMVIGVVLVKIYATKSLMDLLIVLCAPGGVLVVILGFFVVPLISRMRRVENQLSSESASMGEPTPEKISEEHGNGR